MAILIHDIVFGRWDKNGLVSRPFPAFQNLNTENGRLVYFGSSELVSILQVIKVNYLHGLFLLRFLVSNNN